MFFDLDNISLKLPLGIFLVTPLGFVVLELGFEITGFVEQTIISITLYVLRKHYKSLTGNADN